MTDTLYRPCNKYRQEVLKPDHIVLSDSGKRLNLEKGQGLYP